ncbi:MAG TPA: T9SS type A sorting domain-containing protein [Bacteroidales bacterium]|nr:T9SS type A sorting domain-containing protein [Bacteroidales bacterium]
MHHSIKIRLIAFLFFLIITPIGSLAQLQIIPDLETAVWFNSEKLTNPWAGGFNTPQFSEMDLNKDGVMDLVAFERGFYGSVKCFLNTDSGWKYAPEYHHAFPEMRNWMLLRDYNCDGLMDIFTSVPGGVSVWQQQTKNDGSFQFVKKENFLQSTDSDGVDAPIYIAVTDIPAIIDMDDDGDLDILSFNLVGSRLEFHRNLSQELVADCGELIFEKASNCWGYFSEDGNNNTVTLFDTCDNTAVRDMADGKHAGSTILALDLTGNGLKDLLLGDITYENLVSLINGGNLQEASMISQQTDYPSNSLPVDLAVFPAAYHLDADKDGINDLLITPNNPNNSRNTKQIWWYKNVSATAVPEFVFQQDNYLIESMIDLGERSYPVFFDADADGLMDIVAGSFGIYQSTGNYISQLLYLRNIGSSSAPEYEWITDDYAGLSVFGFDGVYPAFGDLDGDGDAEMLIGDETGHFHLFENKAAHGAPAEFVLTNPNYFQIDVGQSAKPQLIDVNNDGLTDIISGERGGSILYFENTGTGQQAQFSTEPTISNWGKLNVLPDEFTGFSAPFLTVDSLGNSLLYVGSEQGWVYAFDQIDDNLQGEFRLIDSSNFYGMHTALNGYELPEKGNSIFVSGSFTGGIGFYRSGTPTFYGVDEFTFSTLKIQPNPVTNFLRFELPAELTEPLQLAIYNTFGQLVMKQSFLPEQLNSIELKDLASGLYLLSLKSSQIRSSGKFLVK